MLFALYFYITILSLPKILLINDFYQFCDKSLFSQFACSGPAKTESRSPFAPHNSNLITSLSGHFKTSGHPYIEFRVPLGCVRSLGLRVDKYNPIRVLSDVRIWEDLNISSQNENIF